MKILILNPPDENTVVEYPNEEGEGYLEADDFGAFPPLGALYVLTYLQEHTTGHALYFKDCVGERISHAELPGVVRAIQPDVVGISSFTISLLDVIQVARTVRAVVPGAHLCMGGHHPIAFPFEAAQLPEFDSIIVGEGEVAFTELVKALEEGRDFTGIQGVYTRDSIQGWRERDFHDKRFLGSLGVMPGYIEEIDSLPFPDRRFISHIDYHSVLGISARLATIITSRGCPYQCTFCDVPYKRYRRRSTVSVMDEVEACLAMGYEEIHFYDDLFNVSPRKVIEFCDEVERRGLTFHWDFRGRVNTVTRESLQRARRAGCRMISFGVETSTDAGLAALKKGTDVSQIQKVFQWCHELGIKTVADFMIGLPFERTEADIQNNLAFAHSLNPDYCQISVLNLYPNTALYDQASQKGLIDGARWQRWALDPKPGFHVDHWEEHIPVQRQMYLQRQAYRRFYMRPQYILRSLLGIRSWFEFKIKFNGFLKLFR
ncbi:MAG: radical SAM protein [Magnetococcales bacterium]|nr:radical SAM protein [Magnetococcales bacterium]MBF0322321.1 radical SAM protein [Magnetococcales bacterium]